MTLNEREWLRFFEKEDVYAFCAKISEDPDDLAPKLVFADWIEENCPEQSFVDQYRQHLSGKEVRLEYPFLGETYPKARFHQGRIWIEDFSQEELSVPLRRLCRSGIVSHFGMDGSQIDEHLDACPLLHSLAVSNDFCWQFAEKGRFSSVKEFAWFDNTFVRHDQRLAKLLNDTDHCANLTTLEFRMYAFQENDVEALAKSQYPRQLKKLVVDDQCSFYGIADATFLKADKFFDLEVLDCVLRGINNASFLNGLATNTKMRNLRVLSAYLPYTGYYDWKYFFGLPIFKSLEVLDFFGIKEGIDLFVAIAHSPRLTNLKELHIPKVPDELKSLFTESPYLPECIKRQYRT